MSVHTDSATGSGGPESRTEGSKDRPGSRTEGSKDRRGRGPKGPRPGDTEPRWDAEPRSGGRGTGEQGLGFVSTDPAHDLDAARQRGMLSQLDDGPGGTLPGVGDRIDERLDVARE